MSFSNAKMEELNFYSAKKSKQQNLGLQNFKNNISPKLSCWEL